MVFATMKSATRTLCPVVHIRAPFTLGPEISALTAQLPRRSHYLWTVFGAAASAGDQVPVLPSVCF